MHSTGNARSFPDLPRQRLEVLTAKPEAPRCAEELSRFRYDVDEVSKVWVSAFAQPKEKIWITSQQGSYPLDGLRLGWAFLAPLDAAEVGGRDPDTLGKLS